MSKLNIIKDVLLTCIFIILGIPLIIVSTQSSDVLENSNQLPNDNDGNLDIYIHRYVINQKIK